MWYIVLMDAFHPTQYELNDAIPVSGWPTMSEDAHVDKLNEWTQIVGMHCAGAYEAENETAAFDLAMRDVDDWINGCVA